MVKEKYYEFKVLTERIKDFKEKNSLTYQEIGDALGVNKSHVHRVFNMDTFPSLKFVIRLARFMKLPLFALFIPSEEISRKELGEKINQRLEEMNWDLEKLSDETEIPILPLMDITQGTRPSTLTEQKAILESLDLVDIPNSYEVKINLVQSLLADLGLKEQQIENVVKYITDNAN